MSPFGKDISIKFLIKITFFKYNRETETKLPLINNSSELWNKVVVDYLDVYQVIEIRAVHILE